MALPPPKRPRPQKKRQRLGSKKHGQSTKRTWDDYAQEGSIKKLQVNMANIRRKIGDKPGEGEQNYITNELGVGYRLNE